MTREEAFNWIWDLLKGDAVSPYHSKDDQYFVVKLSQSKDLQTIRGIVCLLPYTCTLYL